MTQNSKRRRQTARIGALLLAALTLTACEEGAAPGFLKPGDGDATTDVSRSTKLVERDVEAPEVFQVTEAGLWDGRPSLGGVWVAHPDVTDPERVIIRNQANGKFVIGALFRRERDIPGPRLQVSSDAAAALGMLAGAPVELNVTALRREEVSEDPEPEAALAPDAPAEVSETELDPVAGAAAAIEAAEPAPVAAAPAPPAPQPRASSLDKPYIQIGIFSVEANAKRTAEVMRNEGMVPEIRKQTASNKTFWRVLVGPAQSKSERSTLLKKVKGAGFSDAYAVTN